MIFKMYLFSEEVTQIAQMTQIFSSIIPYPQMRPIRSDLRRFSQLHCSPLGKRFFDSPAPLCEEGGLIPLPSPRPYHKGKGCSWRRYSSARVLVSQRSLCSKGLAGMLNQYFPISSWAFFKARILNSFSTRFFTSFSILSSIIWLRGRENGCQP